MMKLYAAPGLRRPTTATIRATAIATTTSTSTWTLNLAQTARPLPPSTRHYATTNPESKRRAVTPFNDDGHIPWTNLSAAEKTARATQQTFNFGMVLVGLVLTVCALAPPSTTVPHETNNPPGRSILLPLPRSLLPRQQNRLLQPRSRPHQEGPSLSRAPRRRQKDHRLWRRNAE